MGYESGSVYGISIEDWYVTDPPVYEMWPRGRNWLARVCQDADAPGGYRREWCERGRGRLRYNVTGLLEGDAIEFGADRIWASGQGRTRVRWVGEIVKFTEDRMLVRYFESLEEMFAFIHDRDSRTREAAP